MRITIDAHIVCIFAQSQVAYRRKVRPAEHSHRSVATICDIDGVRSRVIADSLRLIETGHRAKDTPCFEIHDADRVVSEFGDIQTLASGVVGKVIDSPRHLSEWNLCF